MMKEGLRMEAYMSTLADLHATLQEGGLETQFEEGMLLVHLPCVQLSGRQMMYPFHLIESKYGLLRGEIWFRRIAAHEIEHVNEFCAQVNRHWGLPPLGFSGEQKRFFLSGLIDPDSFEEDAAQFLALCEAIEPLCLTVGKTGKWIESFDALFTLAATPNEEFVTS